MTLKNEAKKEYQREYMRKRRSNKTEPNSEGLTEIRVDTPISDPVTYTGLARLISTPQGKKKLDQILGAFNDSSHPEYMQDVRLGIFGPTLWAISKL